MTEERFTLARERAGEIAAESVLPREFQTYFVKTARFLAMICEEYDFIREGGLLSGSLEELAERNRRLYEDILPENYGESYANPQVCAQRLGEEYGPVLCALYAELRSLIPLAYERRLEEMVIRMELFLEIYGSFCCAREDAAGDGEGACGPSCQESGPEQGDDSCLPDPQALRESMYWYVNDYARDAAAEGIRAALVPEADFARGIVEGELSDPRYLYYFGEYVTENEIGTWRHLASLGDETLQKMADTYTEGYRMGFAVGNKDISKKRTVGILYSLGFEPMIRRAIRNFREMGLEPTIYRMPSSLLYRRRVNPVGYFGAIPNKQYDFDHKDDLALVLDKKLMQVQLEALKEGYGEYKEQAAVYAGPAVVETFGQRPAELKDKKQALHLSPEQQRLSVEYLSASGEIRNRYIREEERSFTIIAFPTPEIGEQFGEIFDEVIRINTLDYRLYQQMQQRITDTLDLGKYVLIKGMKGNRTNLKVMLHHLEDGGKQTNFENCVADVNIPVGEVFTSPVLAGTEGTLHVSRAYLNELEYQDLCITIKDGMTAEYSCANFESREENLRFIRDNLLFHHESLPLGEFAIGTNTTAFVAARRYGIEDRLPILIAEKTGPHFAMGDTCYSHAEEVKVYNPDGKEIIARDNECSLKRREGDPSAYFNCHTDITIPYSELGEISVVTYEEQVIPIIVEGRFVLEGCEELNRPLEEAQRQGILSLGETHAESVSD